MNSEKSTLHITLRAELRGSYVHQRIFIGTDADHVALAGTLVHRINEWRTFSTALMLGVDVFNDVISMVKTANISAGIPDQVTISYPDDDQVAKEIAESQHNC